MSSKSPSLAPPCLNLSFPSRSSRLGLHPQSFLSTCPLCTYSHFPPHPSILCPEFLRACSDPELCPAAPHSGLYQVAFPGAPAHPAGPVGCPITSHRPSLLPCLLTRQLPTARPCFPGNNASVSRTTMSFHVRRTGPGARRDVAQRVLCPAQGCELLALPCWCCRPGASVLGSSYATVSRGCGVGPGALCVFLPNFCQVTPSGLPPVRSPHSLSLPHASLTS